ncbi:MAG: DUF3108 domain-containing protein [Opitutaceae bacterium]|nr:DUF3108 domain-containing protein [Opitutaceae bacterium]MBP9913706.1 DUF3108 domain-containing protein [Opitutaceae bacterium]
MTFRFWSVFLLTVAPALAAPVLPMGDGEVMKFRVGWSIFTGAGEIAVSAKAEPAGDVPQLRVTTTTSSGGFLRTFYPFDARAESVYNAQNGRLLFSNENSVSKRKQTQQSLVFDYEHHKASYLNSVRPDRTAELELPEGNPMDLITSLIQTRTWNLIPGEKQDALVIFDDEFYELTIYAEGYEDLRTPLGKFKTLKLVPRMEKTPPKGMFKRGSTVSVWISQDERHLPVRFEVEFKFGAGVATLVEYQPATPAHAQDPRP